MLNLLLSEAGSFTYSQHRLLHEWARIDAVRHESSLVHFTLSSIVCFASYLPPSSHSNLFPSRSSAPPACPAIYAKCRLCPQPTTGRGASAIQSSPSVFRSTRSAAPIRHTPANLTHPPIALVQHLSTLSAYSLQHPSRNTPPPDRFPRLKSIGGLSSQKTARFGNVLGVGGVTLGLASTVGLMYHAGVPPEVFGQMAALMGVGGLAGYAVAGKVG